MDSIKNSLKSFSARHKISVQVQAAMVCNFWEKYAGEFLEKKVIEKSKAISFSRGTIKIAVLGSAYANEIQMQRHNIIEKINKKFGRRVVERVRFET